MHNLTKKQLKDLDKQIERAWYRQADGVQVSILDIPKIFADCRKAVIEDGHTIAYAIDCAISRYEVRA